MNHLSDSVSIVDLTSVPPRVKRTLLVGDEPRDVVFAGPGLGRAFITTAHRGQNTPFHDTIETILRTPGIGRADVWVFHAGRASAPPPVGVTPLTIVTLFGDTPRGRSPSARMARRVYAAGSAHSGNQTTTVSEGVVCDDGNLITNGRGESAHARGIELRGLLAAPTSEASDRVVAAPETGMIVKFDPGASHWRRRGWAAGGTTTASSSTSPIKRRVRHRRHGRVRRSQVRGSRPAPSPAWARCSTT